jgi:L-ribulose-5-phosphate 3-epimerase UlaE
MQDFNSLFEIHANANNKSPMMLSMFIEFTQTMAKLVHESKRMMPNYCANRLLCIVEHYTQVGLM